ncbi:MAG TPA: NADH-quinone oxidoreductase subunit C [Nitrospiria bacterium]|nr:NADH-quinone oxidoreductase subunit C [Nitrospiria bacterium]
MQPIAELIAQQRPGAVLGAAEAFGEQTVLIARDQIVPVCRWLHDEPALAFEQLSDLTAVDWPQAPERFEVVYQLNSIRHRRRLRLKARVPQSACEIDSVHSVWRAAGFLEREVFDLFGIRFRSHPDLRRILMPEDYDEGHPLRKDFPTTGKGWRNTFEFWPAIEPGREVSIDASALNHDWKQG